VAEAILHAYDTVLAYHERSKHRLDRYAPGPGYLDWANQPDPFRTYAGAPRVALPLRADGLPVSYRDLRAGRLPAPAPFTLESIGMLFELSFAISAWKAHAGSRWALRCNPSSGNLHPTEAYLVTAGVPGIEGGAYHYVSRDHVLERRTPLPADILQGGSGVIVGLASIYWREAWKYGMRAFRYCQHDCGHALAALGYAAGALGWHTRLLDEAGDDQIDALLGLDRVDPGVEREQPDCLVWVGDDARVDLSGALDAIANAIWSGNANRLSASHVEWPDIERVHGATVKPDATAITPHVPATPLRLEPALDLPAPTLIRQRRSAVAFDAATSIDADAFYAMLEVLLPDAQRPPWSVWQQAVQVHLALFVHRIEGLEPGLYCMLRDEAQLASVRAALHSGWLWTRTGPEHVPLYQLLPHDVRDAARVVSCHQEIAADSCFSLGMLASFASLPEAPWRYRALYRECGAIGQALYLEAEAAGVRATGIGCFFDDEVHTVLGIQGNAWQSLYHFTVGGAVEDRRLTTLPAYPDIASV
jgi:SagB-type dehydrogenase family enzyme